jgi:hypothetical protein
MKIRKYHDVNNLFATGLPTALSLQADQHKTTTKPITPNTYNVLASKPN